MNVVELDLPVSAFGMIRCVRVPAASGGQKPASLFVTAISWM